MKNVCIFFFFLLMGIAGNAQSVTGRWIKTGVYSEKPDGKRIDIQKIAEAKIPCVNKVIYTFNTDGSMSSDAGSCPEQLKKIIESVNGKTKWVVKGNLISVTAPNVPESVNRLSFSGNKMTWTLLYAENPKLPNPLKAKASIVVYQRL